MSDTEDAIEYEAKILMLGNTQVGKTTFYNYILSKDKCSFRDYDHSRTDPTIGLEFTSKKFYIENKVVKIKLWDSIGQEKYRSLNKNFYREALGAFLLADLSRHDVRKDKNGKEKDFLLDDLEYWLKEFKEIADANVQVILVGNMVDREVIPSNLQIMEQFAKDHNIMFVKTSAKTGENVDETVDQLIELLDKEYFSRDARSPKDKGRKRLTTKDFRSFAKGGRYSDVNFNEGNESIMDDLNLVKKIRNWLHSFCPSRAE